MNLTVLEAQLPQITAEALILPIREDASLSGLTAEIDQATGGAIATALKSRTFKAKAGQVETLYPVNGLGAARVVLVGLGKDAPSAEDWRTAVSKGLEAVDGKVTSVAMLLTDALPGAMAAEAGAEAALLSLYQFHPYQEADPDEVTIGEVVLLAASPAEAAPAAERGAAMARAVNWVRDLSNKPGNMLRVPDLVAEAMGLAKSHAITARLFDAEALDREGLGLVAAVGRGSEDPPAFVVLEYQGGGEEAPIALVGKGITFDTGGICIKPRAGMEEMKTDMHGAATVMGVMRMAAERKLPVNLVGLLSIAENMPAGNAFKPGDILTAYNGMTVEIADTDAEGRLVMADGIAYAVKNHAPRAVIDIATLTGSVIMAVGWEASGLFCDDAVAQGLVAAGEATGERLWRFPTWDGYAENVKSDIADLRNSAKGRGGDAINAGMFLRAFADGVPWAHLDIAGPSWIMEPRPYRPKGSTGVGVRLLIQWLEDGAPIR